MRVLLLSLVHVIASARTHLIMTNSTSLHVLPLMVHVHGVLGHHHVLLPIEAIALAIPDHSIALQHLLHISIVVLHLNVLSEPCKGPLTVVVLVVEGVQEATLAYLIHLVCDLRQVLHVDHDNPVHG